MSEKNVTEVELIKEKSDFLRGNIARDLYNGTDHFEEDDKQLIKFHGIYQQKDRDKRLEGEPEKKHTFMLRGRIPGGRLTAEQYLAWDYLGDRFGGGALRLTTRQSIQLHSLQKPDLQAVIQEIHRVGLTSIGACGDVVRNVTEPINLTNSPLYHELSGYSQRLSDFFKFESTSYIEIWLGEKQENPLKTESIYGATYLPRKFKIAITMATDNSIDIYTNDLGLAATHSGGKIDGFFVFAGGGMGMTHNKAETFPRAADLLGHISCDKVINVATAIVTIHRDFGDRSERKHSRLKYILQEKGVEWFRTEVETRSGVKLNQREQPAWKIPEYHGWTQTLDGKFNFGLYISAGRIKDVPGYRMKSAIQMAVARLKLQIQVTADQDLIFLNMSERERFEFIHIMKSFGINTSRPRPLYRRALACPALPTCSLALTESERNFPHLMRDLQRLLEKHELESRAPLLRMTGCPNGCARPYSAEIGIVGQQNGGKYALFLGGLSQGTRIGKIAAQKILLNELPIMLERLFIFWKHESVGDERLGDFVNRVGIDVVKQILAPADKS